MREDWKRNLPLSGRITCKWPFLTNWDRKGHQSQYQRVSRYVAMLLAGFVRKSGELPKPGNGFQATFVHPVSASNRVKWPWYAMIGHDMGPNFRTNHDLCNATTCCLRLGPWSSASSLTTGPAAALLRIPRSIPASSIKGMSTVHAVWWSKKNVKLAEVPLKGKPAGKSYVILNQPNHTTIFVGWESESVRTIKRYGSLKFEDVSLRSIRVIPW